MTNYMNMSQGNSPSFSSPVFLNHRSADRYQALASITPWRERFSWNLSFYFSMQFYTN